MDPILIEKYNVSVPRYTSYPTVPKWNNRGIDQSIWLSHLTENYRSAPGFSLYIHLPFCEALCTYCGCNKRITKNHKVEAPYINSVLQEWEIYKNALPERPLIKEIHLGSRRVEKIDRGYHRRM
jgi:oxygen-independent coproporphyrinogen-3 oxidase